MFVTRGEGLTVKSQICLAVIAAAVVSGCQSVPDRPTNPDAMAPVVLVTERFGPALASPGSRASR